MLQSVEVLVHHRNEIRRAVDVGAEVLAEGWAGPALHRVRDLSERGAFIESQLLLEPGTEMVLDIVPPGRVRSLTLMARVERAVLRRRRRDRARSGMGVRFVGVQAEAEDELRASLLGLPPPLPEKPRTGPSEMVWIEEVESLDVEDTELSDAIDQASSSYFLTAGMRWWPGATQLVG